MATAAKMKKQQNRSLEANDGDAHPDEDRFYEVALNLVREGGRMVRDAFDQPSKSVQKKESNTDLVTETDKAVENLLIKGLSAEFPDHRFIGEESAAAGKITEYTDAPTWIIDPIDGTTNFVHRVPMLAICVGLAIKKQMRIGIVYNPITNELFSARLGCGAFKNGFPIRVSQTKVLSESLISASLGIHNLVAMGEPWLDTALGNQRRQVLAGIRGHRAFGSAAINMVYVAQGAVDAFVEYGIHSWDVAAAALVVTEAGGVLMDPTGKEFNLMHRKVLCAGTIELARELSAICVHAEYEPEVA